MSLESLRGIASYRGVCVGGPRAGEYLVHDDMFCSAGGLYEFKPDFFIMDDGRYLGIWVHDSLRRKDAFTRLGLDDLALLELLRVYSLAKERG